MSGSEDDLACVFREYAERTKVTKSSHAKESWSSHEKGLLLWQTNKIK